MSIPILLLSSQPVLPDKVPDLFGATPTFVEVVRVPAFPDRSIEVARQNAERLEAERVAAVEAAQAAKALEQARQPVIVQTPPQAVRIVSTGSCADWLAAAGVSDISSAVALINRESGCNPSAVNPSSGACGVAQELPCGKSGCALGDGACQVRWMDQYCKARYGGWPAALAHSNAVGWY